MDRLARKDDEAPSDAPDFQDCGHGVPGAAPDPLEATEEVLERAAAIFRAAGDPSRLALMARLAAREACVTELATLSAENLSTVSQRLRLLRAEGLVSRRREGKHMYYRLADAHVAELIANALDHARELHGE